MKKTFFVIIFALLLFGIWQNCHAVDLLLEYPDVPGAQSPSQATDLPQLINYIYKFALIACGITAFVSMLIGAIQYVTSAGNSSKASEAKDRITSALWGILILLCAVLILRTINPDLVTLSISLPEIKPITIPDVTGSYYCRGCCNQMLEEHCENKANYPTACFGKIDTGNLLVAKSMCEASMRGYCFSWTALGGMAEATTVPCVPKTP
jgi:hypothetical protein